MFFNLKTKLFYFKMQDIDIQLLICCCFILYFLICFIRFLTLQSLSYSDKINK